MFEQAAALIAQYDRIIIHRHGNPDGDALGSQIGMKHILLANFPGKEVYAVGDAPGRYAFMEDAEPQQIPDDFYTGALAIILDTSTPTMIAGNRYTLAATTLRFDHHIFCGKIADVEVVDTSFESCCGLVTSFAMEQGLAVPPIAAQSLYTGMVTDSGRFRYDSTSAGTFERASFLLRQAPLPLEEIYRPLYENDLAYLRLKGKMINAIETTEHGVAYIYTDLQAAAALGADTFTISRGMVNVMADLKGISIWVNFTESDRGVLCELRSNRENINPIAVKYGGGGHAKASGACIPDRETAMAMVADLDALVEGSHAE